MRLLPMKFSSLDSVSNRSRKTGSVAALSKIALTWAGLSLPRSIVFRRSQASQSFSSPSFRMPMNDSRNSSRAVSRRRSAPRRRC